VVASNSLQDSSDHLSCRTQAGWHVDKLVDPGLAWDPGTTCHDARDRHSEPRNKPARKNQQLGSQTLQDPYKSAPAPEVGKPMAKLCWVESQHQLQKTCSPEDTSIIFYILQGKRMVCVCFCNISLRSMQMIYGYIWKFREPFKIFRLIGLIIIFIIVP